MHNKSTSEFTFVEWLTMNNLLRTHISFSLTLQEMLKLSSTYVRSFLPLFDLISWSVCLTEYAHCLALTLTRICHAVLWLQCLDISYICVTYDYQIDSNSFFLTLTSSLPQYCVFFVLWMF